MFQTGLLVSVLVSKDQAYTMTKEHYETRYNKGIPEAIYAKKMWPQISCINTKFNCTGKLDRDW